MRPVVEALVSSPWFAALPGPARVITLDTVLCSMVRSTPRTRYHGAYVCFAMAPVQTRHLALRRWTSGMAVRCLLLHHHHHAAPHAVVAAGCAVMTSRHYLSPEPEPMRCTHHVLESRS